MQTSLVILIEEYTMDVSIMRHILDTKYREKSGELFKVAATIGIAPVVVNKELDKSTVELWLALALLEKQIHSLCLQLLAEERR